MRRYKYTPLDLDTGEIRLIQLHSGAFGDPIRISIVTERLVIPETRPPRKDSSEEIQDGLPIGWIAYETLEGRLLFWNEREYRTTWDHPDPNCDLVTYHAHSARPDVAQPTYEALSYTWGSEDDQSNIAVVPLLQDRIGIADEDPRYISVRYNLSTALKYLRFPDSPRTMFIDAISVNQGDLAERSRQVNRMGDIYKYARRVVVWVGPASSDSFLALHVLDNIGAQVEFSRDGYRLPAPSATELKWYKTTQASEIDDNVESWQAIYSFICRPWFKRLWVKICLIRRQTRQMLTW
jgi:hypothetical protein